MISTGRQIALWVYEQLGACAQEGAQGIGLSFGNGLQAAVCYDNYTKRAITAHIVVKRMTPQFLATIFDYPFRQLGVEKIIAPIVQTNERSIRLVKKMGFTREATLSDAHPDGDLYLYSLKRSECRFTGERYGFKVRSAAGT